MARRKITNSQAVCITLLWGVLCYMLLTYSEKVTFDIIFALVASGIIVFVPIYKSKRHKEE
jgi:amino acid permease